MPHLAEALARDGATREQIAKYFHVSADTIKRWEERYAEFCGALKKGRDYVDVSVENALLDRARGGIVTDEEVIETFDVKTGSLKQRKTITRRVPPDTTATIFWLKNRRPEAWRDKHDIDFGQYSDEELIAAAEGVLAGAAAPRSDPAGQ